MAGTRKQVPHAFIWIFTFSFMSFSQCAEVCSLITNQDCACVAPDISIRCNLTSRPVSPLFDPLSLEAPIFLHTVNLSGLNLTELPLDFFPGNNMTTIRGLQLNDNLLSDIPMALTSLASLTELEMGHNLVTSLPLRVLQAIMGLESLSLPSNRLTHLAFSESINPSTTILMLKNLTLAANEISSIDRGLFAAMPHLTVLDLSHNKLTQLSNTDFAYLDLSLVVLDLSHNDLDDIASLALRNLHHLRTLSLEHNRLRDLSSLHLPSHLRSLDLSHCALTIIDHCQVSGMADLTFLALNGNDLTCTCQLYLLLQWYQNIHHMAGDPDSTNQGRQWTCSNNSLASSSTTTSSQLSSTHLSTIPSMFTHHTPLGTDAPSDYVRYVMSMTECRDTESHCQTLEHAEHHEKGSSQMTMSLNVATSDDRLMASWTYEENGEMIVQGFRLRYIPEDNEPITSPMIPVDQRSYIFKTTGLEQHYMVCLDILSPETTVIDQECVSMKEETNNVIAGILAGVVFLVPCIIATFYVILKDHRIKKSLAHGYRVMAVDEKDLEKNPEDSEEENGNASCQFKLYISSGSKDMLTSGNNATITSTQSQDQMKQENEALPVYGTQTHDQTKQENEALPIQTHDQMRQENEALPVYGTQTHDQMKQENEALPIQTHDQMRQENEALPIYGTLSGCPSTASRQANYNNRQEATAKVSQDSTVQVKQDAGPENKAKILVNSSQNCLTHSNAEQVPCSVSHARVNAGFLCSDGDDCNFDNHNSTHF